MRLDAHVGDGSRTYTLELLHKVGIAQELKTHHLCVLLKSPMVDMSANVVDT